MQSTWDCPSCARRLNLPDRFQGQAVKCPACETVFDLDSDSHPGERTPLPTREEAPKPSEKVRANLPTPAPPTLQPRPSDQQPRPPLSFDQEQLLLKDPVGELFGARGRLAILMLGFCIFARSVSVGEWMGHYFKADFAFGLTGEAIHTVSTGLNQ